MNKIILIVFIIIAAVLVGFGIYLSMPLPNAEICSIDSDCKLLYTGDSPCACDYSAPTYKCVSQSEVNRLSFKHSFNNMLSGSNYV